jgi:biotin-(acetyl-CoA carboxylase) ligase
MESSLRQWQNEAGRLRKMNIDKEAKIADLGSNLRSWYNEAQRLERLNSDHEAKFAHDEGLIRSWMRHSNSLSEEVNGLLSENKRLRLQIEGMEEDENLAVEEIESLLEYINDQTNETFESLADAIGFLLEIG